MASRSRAFTLAVRARHVVGIGALAIAGCARTSPPPARGPAPNVADARIARVSLGTMNAAVLSATDAWRFTKDGRVVASGDARERLSLSLIGGKIRVEYARGTVRELVSPVSFSTQDGGIVSLNQRRYRGDFAIVLADTAIRVVNRVDVEAYLRGVVPRELGVRGPGDRAALEAQAVAARSYVVTRLRNSSRPFDVTATTTDQVYGGVDAEDPLADAAIAATAGLVLMYNGRVVSAPYHSTCGGSTAQPDELWRSQTEPFLQRVSDRIPGSERFYCDIAPRFKWERSWRADTLSAIVERYLRGYAQVSTSTIGDVKAIEVDGKTPSGRVAALWISTDRGRYRVRGNDIRYVLRSAGGELLNSTYFSPEVVSSADGRLTRLTIRGFGYGHGVGMCQWGAIGRARARQDFQTILGTYFPGTTVARAY